MAPLQPGVLRQQRQRLAIGLCGALLIGQGLPGPAQLQPGVAEIRLEGEAALLGSAGGKPLLLLRQGTAQQVVAERHLRQCHCRAAQQRDRLIVLLQLKQGPAGQVIEVAAQAVILGIPGALLLREPQQRLPGLAGLQRLGFCLQLGGIQRSCRHRCRTGLLEATATPSIA